MFCLGGKVNWLEIIVLVIVINCNLSLMEPKSFVNNQDFNAGYI